MMIARHLGGDSINHRLMRWMTLTTGVSILIACAFFITYDTVTGKERMVERSAVLGRVVGINSAVALSFYDAKAATEILNGLAAADQVLAAVIYGADGEAFASYVSERAEADVFTAPPLKPQGHHFAGRTLHVFQEIVFQRENIGHIYLWLDASALATRLWWYLAVSALLIVATAILAGIASAQLRRQISGALTALLESSKAISEGDLSTHVPASTDDEFGILARTFNAMTAGLRELVDQVRQNTGEVATVSRGLEQRGGKLLDEAKRQEGATSEVATSVAQVTTSIRDVNANVELLAETSQETSASILEMDTSIGEIAAHMDQLSNAIDTTSAAATQLTTNIDQVVGSVETLHAAADVSAGRVQELSTSISQVKSNADESHSLSEDSSREASEGMTAVNETIDAIGEIANSFSQLQDRVSRLSEKSQSIDEIVQVITSVAEQTGLLSLNAAIIAAQAGEQGKAFSVVAEQVSALADRSHRSAREIADLIGAVQEDTAAAVSAVAEGSSKVERGVQRSRVAGQVLNQIIEKTATSTNRVREIVDATARQSNDLERVDQAVSEVQQIVSQINQATHDQNAATVEIVKTVENIRSLGTAVRHSTEEQRRGSSLITKAAADVAEMVNQIAAHTNAQQSSSETIQRALKIFTEVAEESSQSAEEIGRSVTALADRASALEENIDRFKTR